MAPSSSSSQSPGSTSTSWPRALPCPRNCRRSTPTTPHNLPAPGRTQSPTADRPSLQAFLPILQLYLYQVSQTLTGPADVNTGLKFLDKTTVIPYNSTKSRYEGTSSSAGVTKS